MIPSLLVLAWLSGATLPAQDLRPLELVREGAIEALVEDDFDRGAGRIRYRLVGDDGAALPLELASPPPFPIRHGQRVRVTGRSAGAALAVDRIERVPGSRVEAADSSWTTGPKRALVILLNFQNDTTQPYTVAQAQATMFGPTGSVAAFYAENSWNATTLSGDVAGWFTAPIAKPTTCDISAIQTQAQNAATAAGYNRANYQFEMYVFPSVSSCGWAGLAYVGWSGAWINQALSTYVAAHEMGHNYGLLHAHSWTCTGGVLAGTCTRSEYGDPFDTMGGGLRQFGAYAKQSLGWLAPGTYASASGGEATYALAPLESASGFRGLQLSTDAGRTYWLEFRQATGFDAGLSGNANVMNGVLVHLAPSAVGGTDLLDLTPDGSVGNAALTVGNSYTDTAASLRFTPTAIGAGAITVHVQYQVTPPTPGFTFLPAAPKAGQTVSFTNTTIGQPLGYVWDFGDGSTSSAKNPTHAFASGGTYTVALIAANAAGPSTAFTAPIPVSAATALAYYSLTPCRLVDTRNPAGPFGGPALTSSFPRTFNFAGRCGVPSTAAAITANVTATRASQSGYISFSTGSSAVNFRAGQTRASNTLLGLGTGATASATAGLAATGTVDLVLDVTGYFQ